MTDKNINSVVDTLCSKDSYEKVFRPVSHDVPMPSIEALGEIMEFLRRIFFPGYYAHSDVRPAHMKYYIGANVDKVSRLLSEQIMRGFCFACADDNIVCSNCEQTAKILTNEFILKLPKIRQLLATDAQAAYEGDPAAKNIGETIFCYPSMKALTNHRVAHELYKLGVPLIPRIISEMAHSKTGIDIHPGATIAEKCFIDHGTGVVIGETCIIGKNVRIYQGVTLGAKSFPKDENGNPVKGIKRHPIIEDNVIIYSGATILGRITIGKNSVIGGNVWLMENIPANSVILKTKITKQEFEDGAGI
jgi:serine O-acetyltransferase